MNDALFYLWQALLRRRTLRFVRSLRRPTSLLGVLALVTLLGCLFYFRDHKVVGQLVRRENLVGGALLMLCGSLFKGFLQRGLVCEPADIEFLFTSPFTQRQIVLYRLLPNYLFAAIQSLVFLLLFAHHLPNPILATICLGLLQIVCFHLATAAAIFGGAISEQLHHRLKWMLLASFFLIAALYLRLEWDFRIVPAFCSSGLFQLLFYPAVSMPEVVNSPALHQWTLNFLVRSAIPVQQVWRNSLYLGGFSLAAAGSLWLVLRLKMNPFEAALGTTMRSADKRQRLQQGRRLAGGPQPSSGSMPLPTLPIFQGVGAVLWKNLVAIRRYRREMTMAGFFVFTYTGFFTALLWIFHDLAKKAGGAPLYEERGFTTGIALFLVMLGFFLQRMFPFDFRRDGQHLLTFRTLPTSPLAVALVEIAVPTMLCLAAQACGVIPLIILGKFDWPTLAFVVLGYPAVALALNSVWNLHYLASAGRQLSGRSGSSTAVGTVLVVALSFLVFYPAGWTTLKIANHFVGENQALAFTLAGGTGLLIQYGVDILLILTLARLFQRFEISRDA